MFDDNSANTALIPFGELSATRTEPAIPTKAELLSRANASIEAARPSLREAAEALGTAQKEYSVSQREMAGAVSMSPAWVNALLQWRRSGYKGDSPFGPTTKPSRVQHAEQRAKDRPKAVLKDIGCVQHAEQRRVKHSKPKDTTSEDAGMAPSDPGKETSPEISSDNLLPRVGDARLLEEFKYAVKNWLCPMSNDAKCEAISYAIKQSGVRGAWASDK
jgi:hypothetical protein